MLLLTSSNPFGTQGGWTRYRRSVQLSFQITGNDFFFFFKYKYVHCNIWDLLILKKKKKKRKVIHCLSEVPTEWHMLCIYLLNLAALPRDPSGTVEGACPHPLRENLPGFSPAGGTRVRGTASRDAVSIPSIVAKGSK